MIALHACVVLTRAPRRMLGVLLAFLVLLVAGTLGARALSTAPGAAVHTIVVGRLPAALALDPRSARAFVANNADATVSVLDLASGQLMRTVRVGGATALAPLTLAVDSATHRVFVANRGDDGAPSVVRVLDSHSGAPLATVRVGPGATALAVDARASHAFVANEGAGTVSMLNARSGAIQRTTPVDLVPVSLAVDARTAHAFVAGPVEPGKAYGPGREARSVPGRVSVLDTRSGALLRTVRVGAAPVALAVDARAGRAFVVAADDNTLSVLDTRDGRVLRTVAVGIMPVAVAVDVRRRRVYVVNAGDGTLSLLDTRTGRVLHTRALKHRANAMTTPWALAVDEARDRIYVTAWGRLDQAGVSTGSGWLFVLDARDGTVRRTLTVGVAPQAVAVEGVSGRVVVIDSGVVLHAPPGWLERWRGQIAGWQPWLRWLAPPAPDGVVLPGSVRVIEVGA